MHTIIKAALTAAIVVAIAWPLLFWGKPGASRDQVFSAHGGVPRAPVIYRPHDDFLW